MTKKQTVTIEGVEYEYKSNPESGDRIFAFRETKEEKKWHLIYGRSYFYLDKYGDVKDRIFCRNYVDSHLHDIGNYYQTKDQAQAASDLKKHIHKFDIPKIGGDCYVLDLYGKWSEVEYKGALQNAADYSSGIIITIDSDEDDRSERLRLLKLVHGA